MLLRLLKKGQKHRDLMKEQRKKDQMMLVTTQTMRTRMNSLAFSPKQMKDLTIHKKVQMIRILLLLAIPLHWMMGLQIVQVFHNLKADYPTRQF
jgi:hypothetical protein